MSTQGFDRQGFLRQVSGGSSAGQATIVLDKTNVPVTIPAATASTTFDTDTFVISNSGLGVFAGLHYTIAYSATSGWLTLTNVLNGDGTYEYTPIINATSLSASTQTATITILDANASNSGITLTVTCIVTASKGLISLSATALTFSSVSGAVGTVQTVTITNAGPGSMGTLSVGTITYGAGATAWMGGVITGSGPWTLTLTPTASSVSVGTGYTASVPVIASGASNTPQALALTLNVVATAPAVISLDRSVDDMSTTVGGADPTSQSVRVTNVGGGSFAGVTLSSVSYRGTSTGWAAASITNNLITVVGSTGAIGVNGTSYADITVSDANSSNSVIYTIILRMGAGTITPTMSVTPSVVSASVQQFTSPPTSTILVSNVGGGSLGTVSVALAIAKTWISVSYDSATSLVTIFWNTATLGLGAQSASIVVTATGASNSPVTVPVSLTVTAVPTPGLYPIIPSLASFPTGVSRNDALGYPTGSPFNGLLASYRELDNHAMPSFGGTERFASTLGQFNTAYAASVDGDIITCTAGASFLMPQFPVRTGWVYGVGGMVWIRSSAHASLPAWVAPTSPVNANPLVNAVDDVTHYSLMPTFEVLDRTKSTVNFQQSSGGVWFTGINFRYIGEDPNGVQALIDLGAKSGTVAGVQTSTAHCPGQIVFDRCIATTVQETGSPSIVSVQATRTVTANGKGIAFYHCDLGFCWKTGVIENKCFALSNTPGGFSAIGNKFAGWGIHLLAGGVSNPAITDVLPSDGLVMWNYNKNDPAVGSTTSGLENKNSYEIKVGLRWFIAYNDIETQWFRADYRQCLIAKSNAQSSGAIHSRVEDVMFWCNRITDSAKTLLAMVDVNSGTGGPGGALGTDRIVYGYNLCVYNAANTDPRYTHPVGASNQQGIYITGSQGDGVPYAIIDHNTWGGRNGLQYGSYPPGETGWVSLQVTNNVSMDVPLYNCILGVGPGTGAYPALNDSPALNREYGGAWDYRRNFVAFGPANWDATLTSANYGNGRMASALRSVNFTDSTNNDFSLTIASGIKGKDTTNAGDPGYSKTYMDAMIPWRA